MRDLLENFLIRQTPGPDNIHPLVLKECAEQLANQLVTVFHSSLKQGALSLTHEWKEAEVWHIVGGMIELHFTFCSLEVVN